MAPCVDAAGSLQGAVRLDRWNVDFSCAVYAASHILADFLRNALDERLCVWNEGQINPTMGEQYASE